jgi:hypothetical protein
MSGGARLALADGQAGYGGKLGLFWRFYLEYPQLVPRGNSDAPRRKSMAMAVLLEILHAPHGKSAFMPLTASKQAKKRTPEIKRSSKP